MITKQYSYLPESAKAIRTLVFIEEQGFKEEFDDKDNTAIHFVMYDDIVPVATCRILYDNENSRFMIGRVAVIKEYRAKRIGSLIMKEAENYIRDIGGKTIAVSAQCRTSAFYNKHGFIESGEMYYEEFCPHILMIKDL